MSCFVAMFVDMDSLPRAAAVEGDYSNLMAASRRLPITSFVPRIHLVSRVSICARSALVAMSVDMGSFPGHRPRGRRPRGNCF